MCLGHLLNTAIEHANVLSWDIRGTWGAGRLRLDSEHFRFAPRTCRPPCGRLKLRKT